MWNHSSWRSAVVPNLANPLVRYCMSENISSTIKAFSATVLALYQPKLTSKKKEIIKQTRSNNQSLLNWSRRQLQMICCVGAILAAYVVSDYIFHVSTPIIVTCLCVCLCVSLSLSLYPSLLLRNFNRLLTLLAETDLSMSVNFFFRVNYYHIM